MCDWNNVWLKQCVTSMHILFFTNWCIMLLKCIEHHTQFFLPSVESVTLRYWFLPNALMKIKWLMRGWERGFNSPLFSSPPLLLASLVPTGGHQPHDSTSLPVGPSEIPPLYFSDFFSFLLLFLKNSDIQEAEKFLGKKRYIEVLTRQTMCSVARDEFGNVGFDHRFRPRALFRVKTFTSPPLPSPTIFLQPVIQRAAAHTNFLPSLQHTARERLSFINIHFSC